MEGVQAHILREGMVLRICFVFWVFSGVFLSNYVAGEPQTIEGSVTNQDEAIDFLQRNEVESSNVCNVIMETSWNYHTNVTEFNRRNMLAAQLQGSEFRRNKWREATRFRWRSFSDPGLRRLFSFTTVLGNAALPADERLEYAELLQDMKTTYAEARICPYNPNRLREQTFTTRPRTTFVRSDNDFRDYGFLEEEYDLEFSTNDDDTNYDYRTEDNCIPTLHLEPDIVRIMAESRNPNELRYIWRAWREAAGRPLRRKYLRFIKLSNKAAKLNGFNSTTDFWQKDYEGENFEEEIERIWEEVRPLYLQLHAYVRRKLKERYGEQLFSFDGTIPAHLLGNMWGQSWLNLLDITIPYSGRPFLDVTQNMIRQGYTPVRIYRTAEDFFTSLGFSPLPASFWLGSVLEEPRDRPVICHASAWDFCNGVDYRIKQCTQVTMKDFITAHHELGHVYYGMAYKNLPHVYRDGANPGFHEAIGDAIALSVATPSHLAKIGLLSSDISTFEDDINFLFTTALDKIAFLPFGLMVDKWRWKVFNREVEPRDINVYWWQLKVIYQGISPPVFRSPLEFDPGSKYHIPAHIPYIRYFVGYILQFQIHEELCLAAGHQGDLHKCDIYGSREAGEKLAKLLSLGKSQPWQVALSDFTDGRTNRLDAGPMLRYFRHLNDWLARENRNDQVGWHKNQALFALTGALINTSSATFIGILVAACAVLFLMGCLSVYCYRKLSPGNHPDRVPS